MHFKILAIATLASVAHAEWAYIPSDFASSITGIKNDKQASSASQVLAARISNHLATLTTRSDYLQLSSEEVAFLATRTGVPAIVTATDRTTTYTTKPPWYDELPSGVKSLYEEELKVASSLVAELQGDVNKANGAARTSSVGLGLYVSGALVGVVAGLAAVL